MVQIIQAALPIDPNKPGITVMTRPVGSINGKNGCEVMSMCESEPVTEVELIALHEAMTSEPFRTVCNILPGRDNRISPCPKCGKPDSSMGVGPYTGQCYNCNSISLADLYDLAFDFSNEEVCDG